MKKNYKRLLFLLTTLPALMANAPAPQVFAKDYKDFSLTFVKNEQVGDNYYYTYHLKNSDKGYIDYIHLGYQTKDEYYGCSYYSSDNAGPFYDVLIQPGFDADIVFSTIGEIPEVNKLKPTCRAYAIFDDTVTIIGSKKITLKSHSDKNYYYKVDLEFQYSDSNWHYGAVLKTNYNDNIYYVKVDETKKFTFQANEELDLTKLEILDMTVIKSRPYMYGVIDGITIIAIIFLVCFFVVISAGIFAAIFIPAMVRRRRRRRREAANK